MITSKKQPYITNTHVQLYCPLHDMSQEIHHARITEMLRGASLFAVHLLRILVRQSCVVVRYLKITFDSEFDLSMPYRKMNTKSM